VKDGFF